MPGPMSLVRRVVPPRSVLMPTSTSRRENFALSAAMRISHAVMSSMAVPMHAPWMPATTGRLHSLQKR